MPRERQPSHGVWPPSTEPPPCHGTGLGTARPCWGGRDPTWCPLLQIPLQGAGWGRGGRVGLVGDTHPRHVAFPLLSPRGGGLGAVGPKAGWPGCGVLHPKSLSVPRVSPCSCPCSVQPSPLLPGQRRVSPGGARGGWQSSPSPPSPPRGPLHPAPGGGQGRDRGISSSVAEAQGQQAQGRREELAEMLVLQSF